MSSTKQVLKLDLPHSALTRAEQSAHRRPPRSPEPATLALFTAKGTLQIFLENLGSVQEKGGGDVRAD